MPPDTALDTAMVQDSAPIDSSQADSQADTMADSGPDAPGPDATADSAIDTAVADTGVDASLCPAGPVGSTECPYTSLVDAADAPPGIHWFEFPAATFRGLVDDSDGGGWLLVASADDSASGSLVPSTGPVLRQSHSILSPSLVAALPDIGVVRIDSSAGSNTVASVTSSDPFVLDQLRAYQSLHPRAAEDGTLRWSGPEAWRMTSTCANAPQEDIGDFIFVACGAPGLGLHWRPVQEGTHAEAMNSWTWSTGTRDRLNLWVRAGT